MIDRDISKAYAERKQWKEAVKKAASIEHNHKALAFACRHYLESHKAVLRLTKPETEENK